MPATKITFNDAMEVTKTIGKLSTQEQIRVFTTALPDGTYTSSVPEDLMDKITAPVDDTPITVTEVASSQAKILLSRLPGSKSPKTLLDDVKDIVAKADIETQIWFSDARTWIITNPKITSIAEMLKIDGTKLSNMFLEASKIET